VLLLATIVISFVLSLVTIVISFVLTALVGNWLVQRWQQRNWLTQHTLQSAEKQIEELRILVDELLRLGDARTFRTRRFVRQLNNADLAKFEQIKEDYERAVVEWNDRFNSMCVGLTMYAAYQPYTERLEGSIQPLFVKVSDKLDTAIHIRANQTVSRSSIAQMDNDLNEISGELFAFGRDLVRLLLVKQQEAYDGKPILFSRENLELFPRWYLLKALFHPPFPPQAVSSAALNLSHPFVSRSQGSWVH
jgi:type II secretory pathway pseudopilin PulG